MCIRDRLHDALCCNVDSVIIRFATPLKDVPVCFSVTVCSLSELLGSQSDLRNFRNIFIGHTLSYLHILSISVTLVSIVGLYILQSSQLAAHVIITTYLVTYYICWSVALCFAGK